MNYLQYVYFDVLTTVCQQYGCLKDCVSTWNKSVCLQYGSLFKPPSDKRLSTVCTMANHCPLLVIYLYVACLHIHDFWLRCRYDSPRFVKSSCTVNHDDSGNSTVALRKF